MGAGIVYYIFTSNISGVSLNGVFVYLIAAAIGIFCVASALFGFTSAFNEYQWVPLNYFSPFVSLGLAALLIYGAATQDMEEIYKILFISGAAINLLNPIGVGLIIKAEGREWF